MSIGMSTSSSEAVTAHRARDLVDLRRAGFHEIVDVEERGPYIVAEGSRLAREVS